MCDLIEEIIVGEGEQLAERIFEIDYGSLSARQRYLLRLAAIAHLGLADVWVGNTVTEESTLGNRIATAKDASTPMAILSNRS